MPTNSRCSAEQLELAAAALKRGELVAMPTETVYGLAADARNALAIARVFALKGRPANHPVIVHVGNVGEVAEWAREVPDAASVLAAAFWPGPLTMILPRAPGVLDAVTGGQDSVGIRMPRHPVALALLARFGGALVAPSANRFGHVSPTTAEHVRAEFEQAALPIILDGGACELGIESTIVDLRSNAVRVLRPGSIAVQQIADLLHCEVALGPAQQTLRVSGALLSHYAPRTHAELHERAALVERYAQLRKEQISCVLMMRGPLPPASVGIALPQESEPYAQQMYAALRSCDSAGVQCILIEAPPDEPRWHAVLDRLRKAVHRG